MQIRESNEGDKDLIREVHRDAFGETEGEVVSQLAIDLLEDETALPVLSLIAEEGNDIIGHVIFSSVKIDGATSPGAYILAPLAVAGDFQRGGIGTDLIKQGLGTLRERDAKFVLVLGDPKYYSRTGFTPDHGLRPPYELAYPEAWMAHELRPGALTKTRGTIECAVSLNSPELW